MILGVRRARERTSHHTVTAEGRQGRQHAPPRPGPIPARPLRTPNTYIRKTKIIYIRVSAHTRAELLTTAGNQNGLQIVWDGGSTASKFRDQAKNDDFFFLCEHLNVFYKCALRDPGGAFAKADLERISHESSSRMRNPAVDLHKSHIGARDEHLPRGLQPPPDILPTL